MIKSNQDMKKFSKFCITVGCCFALVSPFVFNANSFVFEKNVATADVASGPIILKQGTLLSSLVSGGLDGTFELGEDLVFKKHTPIGNFSSQFTGSLDGKGFSITIESFANDQTDQALFAYTLGAIIENVEIIIIEYNIPETQTDPYTLSSFVANANDTTIQNCERTEFVEKTITEPVITDPIISEPAVMTGELVDTTPTEPAITPPATTTQNPIKTSATIGGFCGKMENTDIIDCINFADIDILANSNSGAKIYAGGIAGEVFQHSTIRRCVNNAGINITQEGENPSNAYLGTIAGSLNGTTGINAKDIVSNSSISTTDENAIMTAKSGLFGRVLTNSGNLSNIAIFESIEIFGENDGNYTHTNTTTKDNIQFITEKEKLSSKAFFENKETDGFKWDSEGRWDFEKIYTFADEKLRLQIFQTFAISFASPLDNFGLLNSTQTENTLVAYNKPITLEATFKDPEKQGFYTLQGIEINNQKIENLQEKVDDVTPLSNVFYQKTETGFIITIISSKQTEGKYKILLEAKKYSGRLLCGFSSKLTPDTLEIKDLEGCSVNFGTTTLTKKDDFTESSYTTKAVAKTGSKFAFLGWVLFYENTDGTTVIGDKKFNNKGYVFSEYTDEKQTLAGNSLNIDFGGENDSCIYDETFENNQNSAYFNHNFALVAVFESDPFILQFDIENSNKNTIKSITIDQIKDGENLQDFSEENSFAEVGKNDKVEIIITLKNNFLIDEEKLIKNIKGTQIDDKTFLVDINHTATENENIYTVSFKTSKLEPNENNTFAFEIPVIENNQTTNNSSYLGWIIGGSVGGGLLLIGLVVLIVYLVKRGKYSKTVEEKNTVNPDDYKKFM